MTRTGAAAAALAACLALAVPAAGEAPRPLVPEIGTPPPEPAPPVETPPISVTPLAPPDAASLGSGVPVPLSFAGSEPARLLALLGRLDFPAPAEAVKGRLVALLAAPWPGASGGPEVLLARARALASAGGGEEAAGLVLLPAGDAGFAEARLLAAEALAQEGATDRACAVAEPLTSENRAAVALRFACAFLRGERDRAALVLDLAQERGVELPANFLALAGSALAGAPLPPDPADDDTRAARLLLFGRLPLALDGPLPASATPALLRVVAGNGEVAAAIRLDAAERAGAANLLPVRELRSLMQALAPADIPEGVPRDPPGRAAFVRAIFAEELPAARATLLQRAVPAVPAGIERVRWLELLGPAAVALPVDPSLLWALDGILPPLLAAGDFARAGEWLGLARSRGAAETAVRAAGGAAVLAGLLALPADTDGPALQRALLAALSRGLGLAVPEALWTRLAAEEPAGAPVPPPAVSLWSIAADALAAGRTGEAVLAALALLGPAPEAASPQALGHSLAVLRQAGEGELARRLAVAVALALRL